MMKHMERMSVSNYRFGYANKAMGLGRFCRYFKASYVYSFLFHFSAVFLAALRDKKLTFNVCFF